MRIEITVYYPAPLTLSENVSLLGDDLQSKFENLDEPTIEIDSMLSAASDRVVEPVPQRSPSQLAGPAVDVGPPPVATGSAASVALSNRPRQTDKRQVAKKSRAGGTAGGSGSPGTDGEEQIFNYVVQRFDDDVRFDFTPPPPPSDPSPKDDRKPPTKKSSKKKGQQDAQVTDRPADDVAVKTPMTEAELRRVAAERLWNVKRSSTARHTIQRLTMYVT